MNHSMISTLLLVLPLGASAAEEKTTWSETFPVGAAPQVQVSNVWGDVRVRSGPAGQVTVQARERRWAPSQQQLELSREWLWLDVNVTDDTVRLAVDGDDQWQNYKRTHRPNCRGCRLEYQFDLTVPADAVLKVSTVNDGVIDVQGVAGPISASNVNGPVTVHDLHDCEEISSVNGEVQLSFAAQPGHDCRLNTINGDIVATLPAGVGLDLAVDLFNGRIISGMDVEPVAMPAAVTRSESGSGVKFKIEKPVGLRIGRGGPRFEVESLNGDVRLGKTP